MTHDELKKASQWQGQLTQFALSIKDDVKGNADWVRYCNKILDVAYMMGDSVQRELDAVRKVDHAAS